MRKKAVVRRFALLVIACALPCAAAEAQEHETKRLTLHRAKVTGPLAGLRLLPGPDELTNGDAFASYAKAIESMPKGLDWKKITSWRASSLEQLPLDEIASMLQQFDSALKLLEQAGMCNRCDWPVSYEDTVPPELKACREVAHLLALKARYHIACGEHGPCTRTFQTSLALARHLSTGPTLLHLIIGAGVSGLMCRELELYIQQPGAGSLEAALRAIPKPLFDETHSEIYGLDEASQSRTRLLLARVNRHIIALQYIETLRLHATKAGGMWPMNLEALKANLPNDPITGQPLVYKRLTGTRATLEGVLPEGGDAKDVIRYELNIAEDW